MQASDWEARLTDHYLRSDGPYGGRPIAFVDATPEELNAASGCENWSAAEARASFLGAFRVTDVRDWLDGRSVPPRIDGPVPGYLRYLLLTCLVIATDEDVGTTHDFRDRLGHVLGTGAPFQSVAGVNRLWAALAGWCERRRELGEPIRRLVLPPPGNMTLIGHAVRIAFPAWRDRAALARLLATISPVVRQNPYRLVEELRRPGRWWTLPTSIQEVCDDFAHRLVAGDSLLLTHRFWVLVASIETTLPDGACRRSQRRWRLDAWFGGYEADEVLFRLVSEGRAPRRGGGGSEVQFEGGLAELLGRSAEDLPGTLADALGEGVLLLVERQGGRWVYDGTRPNDDDGVILLARADQDWAFAALDRPCRIIECGWRLSSRLEIAEIRELWGKLGDEDGDASRLTDLKVEGGLRTGIHSFLGRPGFLPSVAASRQSTLSIRPLGEAPEGLTLEGRAPLWSLRSTRPLTGRWMLTAAEGGLESDAVVFLEQDGPERDDLFQEPPNGAFELEQEAQRGSSGVLVVTQGRRPLPRSQPASSEIEDILAATYTGPAGGWSESELVPLIQGRLQDPRMVWDLIRALAEAGWIDPYVSMAWRARRWRLRHPRLVDMGGRQILVDGAIGSAARRRLGLVAAQVGGELHACSGSSELSPPSLLVLGASADELSKAAGWPMEPSPGTGYLPAPRCWLPEARTIDGRTMVGIWSFELGLFVRPDAARVASSDVILERWTRERGDDRDVFRVRSEAGEIMLSSRTAAILEAYRQARRTMFRWEDGRLTRSIRSGYLPLPLARSLRLASLASAGPCRSETGGWSYVYEVGLVKARHLQSLFGAAISVPSEMVPVWQSDFVRSRRLGRRVALADILSPRAAPGRQPR